MTETRLSDAVNPILFQPWEEPNKHWDFSADAKLPLLKDVRRPSQPSVALGRMTRAIPSSSEPYRTINLLRERVADWRKAGYPGSSVRKLLTSWQDRSLQDEGIERPFFCQREAVETLAWLLTCKHDVVVQQTWSHLAHINAKWNDGLNRIAIKMATGAGKTRCMAMMQAVLSTMHPNGCHILVITPNLTVQERLQELYELQQDRSIVSVDYPRSAKLYIVNFQKFRRQDNTFSGLDGFTSMHRKVLGTPVQLESSEQVIDRLLRDKDKTLPFYIFQDEGHHCRRDQINDPELKDEELYGGGQWYQTLLELQKHRSLQAVIDFSGTPFYLDQPKELDTPLFPWCVTDFSVEDAQESGICKIARLPLADSDEMVLDSNVSKLVELYDYCQKRGNPKRWSSEPPFDVQEVFIALANDWKQKRWPDYKKNKRTPVLIAVMNSIHNARVLYQWIAGTSCNNKWKAGAIDEFSNIDKESLQPKKHLPTLVVHSHINDSNEINSVSKQVVDEQLKLRAPGKKQLEALKIIRKIFQTVGKKGKPGEKIRCVISVAMLSEGWDAKTVTHIFGFRKFSSLLLCEQVIGRALRRPSLDNPSITEYAEVIGVPYPGLIAINEADNGESPDPILAYEVFSVLENKHHRLYWPKIKAIHTKPADGRRYRLKSSLVKKWSPAIPDPVMFRLKDPIRRGETAILSSDSIRDRQQRVLFQLAKLLSDNWVDNNSLKHPLVRKGVLFVDACKAITEWCNHPLINIGNLAPLNNSRWRELLVAEVESACVNEEGQKPSVKPVWDNPSNPNRETFSDTGEVHFETTLKHRYPDSEDLMCKTSELNRAACHSNSEVSIAAQLDSSELIRHWVRNFRLGWRLPWWDPATIQWREYEPDFLVELNTDEKCYIVVEMKGVENDNSQNKEQAAVRWCELVSKLEYPECKGDWKYVLITNPQELENKLQAIRSSYV